MNKLEYIVELTKLMLNNTDEVYLQGVMDAIRLAHQLDNCYGQPTAGDVVREIDKRDAVIEAIKKYFRVDINVLDQRVVAHHINRNEPLQAVKAYKEATGGTFGLKECKHDVDRVRTEIGSMTRGEYEAIWEKMPY